MWLTWLHPLSTRKGCHIVSLRKVMYEIAENGACASLFSWKGIYSACSSAFTVSVMFTYVTVWAHMPCLILGSRECVCRSTCWMFMFPKKYPEPLWKSGPFYWMANVLLCPGHQSFLGDGTSHTQTGKVLGWIGHSRTSQVLTFPDANDRKKL